MSVPDTPLGVPNPEVILRRYHGSRHHWRPTYLPFIEQHLGDESGYVRGHPGKCGGPRRNRDPPRGYPCNKVHWCTYCWERRCRQGGVLAAFTHAGMPRVVKFSVSLPATRTDLSAVQGARKAFIQVCRDAGYSRWTVWIHAFGDNPAHGFKGHLDGYVSGPLDADGSVFVDHGRGFRDALAKHHNTGDHRWDVHVHNRLLDPSSFNHVKDLVLGGFYAGRPTFPTRRVYAGLYRDDQDFRVRLTTVNRKTRSASQVQRLTVDGRLQPDWSEADLHLALKRAEAWKTRVAASRRQPTMGLMSDLLKATNWRRKYRLQNRYQLEERYG